MNKLQDLKELLSTERSIVIVTHHKPDADALGSSLALYHYFSKYAHRVTVISPTDFPFFLEWMPGADKVLDFEKKEKEAEKLIENAALIFCLDFNRLDRINRMEPLIVKSEAKKVLIDHHTDPGQFDDYRLLDSNASSTAELIYDFIANIMDDKVLIDKPIADCLYAGIMTDTGSFRFSATTARVHRIIAELLDKGVDNTFIHESLFDNFPEIRTRFLGYCIKDKLQVFPEYCTSLITISQEELKNFNVMTGDTEGIVNFALAVRGVRLSAIIVDRKEVIKLSFRSKGNFPVNSFAKEHFNGGGHMNAAGGFSNLTLEKTAEKFINILPRYKKELNNI